MKEKLYILTYKEALEGESGELVGSKYILDHACKTCGTGAILDGNLVVKKIKENKAFIQTLDRDFLTVNDIYHTCSVRSLFLTTDF